MKRIIAVSLAALCLMGCVSTTAKTQKVSDAEIQKAEERWITARNRGTKREAVEAAKAVREMYRKNGDEESVKQWDGVIAKEEAR